MSLVMVIEDEEAISLLLSYNLEKEGFEVATVSNGMNAVSEVERLMPSVILLDWMLPEISGVEICKFIRSKPDIKNIPIIMLTAKVEDCDKIMGLTIGAEYAENPARRHRRPGPHPDGGLPDGGYAQGGEGGPHPPDQGGRAPGDHSGRLRL